MTTPTHVAVNLGVFLALMQIPAVAPNYADLALMLGSNLIDLDHLLSRPIYHPKRNSFTTHPLHKQWRVLSAVSILMLFFRPIAFLGIGLLLHFTSCWTMCITNEKGFKAAEQRITAILLLRYKCRLEHLYTSLKTPVFKDV